GTSGSQRRAVALRVDRISGDRRAGSVGVRADRRRLAGVYVDGRPAGRRTARHHRPVERSGAFSRARAGRSLAWHYARFSHRLAGELLHRLLERARLFYGLIRVGETIAGRSW